jgi:hypothetical protein
VVRAVAVGVAVEPTWVTGYPTVDPRGENDASSDPKFPAHRTRHPTLNHVTVVGSTPSVTPATSPATFCSTRGTPRFHSVPEESPGRIASFRNHCTRSAGSLA